MRPWWGKNVTAQWRGNIVSFWKRTPIRFERLVPLSRIVVEVRWLLCLQTSRDVENTGLVWAEGAAVTDVLYARPARVPRRRRRIPRACTLDMTSLVSAGDFLSHRPAVGCHYFPPGLRSHSQPAEVCYHPSTSTKLYCLMTEAHRCKQLAQGCYAALPRCEFNPRPTGRKRNATAPHST